MGLHGMQRFFLVKSGGNHAPRINPAPPYLTPHQLIGQKWPIIAFLPQDIDADMFLIGCEKICLKLAIASPKPASTAKIAP